MSVLTARRPPGLADRMALSTIEFYQRRISPRKGFVCAHRVLHGGESCSQFGHRAVAEVGVLPAIRLLNARFGECRAAAMLLAQRRLEEQLADEAEAKRKRLAELDGPFPHWFESCTSWGGTPCFGLEFAACCGW